MFCSILETIDLLFFITFVYIMGFEQGNRFSEASAEQRCSYMNVSVVFVMLICILLSMSSWVMFYILYPRSLLGCPEVETAKRRNGTK